MKRNFQNILIVIRAFLLAACIPAIKETWTVQPISGHVVSNESGKGVAGAKIYAMQNPDQLLAITNQEGYFSVEGESHHGLVLLMAGSGRRSETYIVKASGYNDAFVQAVTYLPAYEAQPVETNVTIFKPSEYASSPACPLKSYVDHLKATGEDENKTRLFWLGQKIRSLCSQHWHRTRNTDTCYCDHLHTDQEQ